MLQVWDHDAWGDNDFLGMASVTINHLKMKMHKFHGFSMKLESDYRSSSLLYFTFFDLFFISKPSPPLSASRHFRFDLSYLNPLPPVVQVDIFV